jgi:FlaG/FlaF family flagellin (archaellin)
MRRQRKYRGGFDDRSVSDVIAFILMFSIIITGVGIVSLGAFGDLTEFSDREKVENSERGLTAMAATLDELHRENDTYRSEIKLAVGGSSSSLKRSKLNITIRDNDTESPIDGYGQGDKDYLNSTEQRFARNPEDVVVSYEGGGVFRRPGYGARYRPSMECRGDIAIVSFVTLKGENFRKSQGGGSTFSLNTRGVPGESPVADLGSTLLFDAQLDGQNRTYRDSSEYDVYLNTSLTANPTQWQNYLNNSGWTHKSPNGPVHKCLGVDAVLVRQVEIEITLLR